MEKDKILLLYSFSDNINEAKITFQYLFKNNRKLLTLTGLSIRKQFEMMRIKFNHNYSLAYVYSINRYEVMEFKLMYITCLSRFWRIPIYILFHPDFNPCDYSYPEDSPVHYKYKVGKVVGLSGL